MSAEIAQWVEQVWPYVASAVGAYGVAVFQRAEDAAVDATANTGRRMLQAVWGRRDERGQAELEAAVQDVAEAPDDTDAVGAMRQQIKWALQDDAGLRTELAGLLPTGEPVQVTASGTRAVAAKTVGVAITGDNNTVQR
ncbi:hypothetical protein AQI95_40680 [Streptomyces yokosukanensis]|uniref:Uncharacterized protein n=1 Tax=Streptomyces yokosukanensis TaxID=67386 RepID=A0A101NTM0_9ACTN|nr:hypothetical protein [Streptomyces yokosukanensis]KUM99105.1 hypothetical protein AQI95_40680 [Streptomyces yokosukanensis]